MNSAQQRVGKTPLIHVADRESDIYDLLAELDAAGQRFILRAAQDRALVPIDDDERRLFDAARAQPISYVSSTRRWNVRSDRNRGAVTVSPIGAEQDEADRTGAGLERALPTAPARPPVVTRFSVVEWTLGMQEEP